MRWDGRWWWWDGRWEDDRYDKEMVDDGRWDGRWDDRYDKEMVDDVTYYGEKQMRWW